MPRFFTHTCKLEAGAAQPAQGMPWLPVGRGTVVLWRCKDPDCPHVEATWLDGNWTLAEIRGDPEPGLAEQCDDPALGSPQGTA